MMLASAPLLPIEEDHPSPRPTIEKQYLPSATDLEDGDGAAEQAPAGYCSSKPETIDDYASLDAYWTRKRRILLVLDMPIIFLPIRAIGSKDACPAVPNVYLFPLVFAVVIVAMHVVKYGYRIPTSKDLQEEAVKRGYLSQAALNISTFLGIVTLALSGWASSLVLPHLRLLGKGLDRTKPESEQCDAASPFSAPFFPTAMIFFLVSAKTFHT
jgi:hypothetical protein